MIFKNEYGQIDVPMSNSILELIEIRVYMSGDYVIKGGSYGEELYIILDGEGLLFGIDSELMAIMRCGTHFNNELGP